MVCHEVLSLETSCPCVITVLFLVPCGFLLPFDVLRGESVRCHLVLCLAHVGVVVLVRVLVGILCPHVGPPSEVVQGTHAVLSLGYAPLDEVSIFLVLSYLGSDDFIGSPWF